MNLRYSHLLVLLCIVSAGCAHHRDVRPGADGINRVVFKTDDKDQGYREAFAQAEHYCKETHTIPVVLKEESRYTGTMNEDTYRNSKTAAKVATAAGSAVHVFGGKKESKAGGVVGIGGGIANAALGQGYTYELRFKCQ